MLTYVPSLPGFNWGGPDFSFMPSVMMLHLGSLLSTLG